MRLISEKCPNCDDSGSFVTPNYYTGDAELTQCEWCWTNPLAEFYQEQCIHEFDWFLVENDMPTHKHPDGLTYAGFSCNDAQKNWVNINWMFKSWLTAKGIKYNE